MHTPQSLHTDTAPSSGHIQGARPQMQTRILDGVITFALSAIFFSVPLFFTTRTMQGVVFEKHILFYVLVLLAVVAWALKGALSGTLMVRRTPLDYPIIAFLAAVIVSTFLAGDRWHAVWGMFGDPSRGVIALIAMIAAFYLIVAHFTPRRAMAFFIAFCVSGGIVALWTFFGLVGIGFLPDRIARVAPLSLIGSLTGLALFLAMMVPLWMTALFGLWRNDHVCYRALRIIGTIAVLVGLAITLVDLHMLLSYVPRVPLAVGTVFFLVFVLARLVRPRGATAFVPMIVMIVIIGFLMSSQLRSPLLSDTIVLPPTVSLTPSAAWEITRAALKEHFFFGFGPAQYATAFSAVRPDALNTEALFSVRFTQGENVLFDALATVGVVGTILLVFVFVTFVSVTFYLLVRDQERNKMYALGLFSAVLIFALTLATQRVEGTMLLIGVLVAALAWVMIYHESGVAQREVALSLKASPKYALSLAFVSIVLIAGVGMSFFATGKIFAADVLAGRAVRAATVTEETIGLLQRAVLLHPREGAYLTRMAQEFVVLANREALKNDDERDLVKLRAYLDNAMVSARVARDEKLPTSVVAAEVYAQIAENRSFYDATVLDEAMAAWEEVGKREPSNAVRFLRQGEIALRKALLIDPKEKADERKDALATARDFFTRAIEKKANFAAAYYQRALIQQALGDIDAAVEDMTKAFVATGNRNVTYAYTLATMLRERDKEDDAARAEVLLRSIIGVNDKEVNAYLALALLYEKKNEAAAAIAAYGKVLEILPDGDGENAAANARQQIQAKIDALRQSGTTVANGASPAPLTVSAQRDDAAQQQADEQGAAEGAQGANAAGGNATQDAAAAVNAVQ